MSSLIRALSPAPSTTLGADTLRSTVRVSPTEFDQDFNLKELATDLDSLYSKSTLTDVVVYAEGQAIHAHKALLAARSPVLQSIFERLTRENRPNVILINDLSYEVVQELISFLYSGKVTIVSLELLSAAERYQIKGLKRICSRTLIKKLSKSTVIDTLIASHVNKCPELETATIKYVSSHWKHVRREKNCSNLYNWPLLLVKVIDCLAKI